MNTEKEPTITPRRSLRANFGAFFHLAVGAVTSIPFALRVLRAPEGYLMKDGNIIYAGKIVRYSGSHYVLATGPGIIFPNLGTDQLVSRAYFNWL